MKNREILDRNKLKKHFGDLSTFLSAIGLGWKTGTKVELINTNKGVPNFSSICLIACQEVQHPGVEPRCQNLLSEQSANPIDDFLRHALSIIFQST